MNWILIGIIACLAIALLRLSCLETYEKWSGGIFYVLADNSLAPVGYYPKKPEWLNKDGIKGILIAGANKETMPFVDWHILGHKDQDVIVIGRQVIEEDRNVMLLFSEPITPEKFRYFQLEVMCPYGWHRKGDKKEKRGYFSLSLV